MTYTAGTAPQVEGREPLTGAQAAVWHASRSLLLPNIVVVVAFESHAGPAELEAAIEAEVRRHRSLRSHAESVPGLRTPVQIVGEPCTPAFRWHDGDVADEAAIDRMADAVAMSSVPLGDRPAVSLQLVGSPSSGYRLVVGASPLWMDSPSLFRLLASAWRSLRHPERRDRAEVDRPPEVDGPDGVGPDGVGPRRRGRRGAPVPVVTARTSMTAVGAAVPATGSWSIGALVGAAVTAVAARLGGSGVVGADAWERPAIEAVGRFARPRAVQVGVDPSMPWSALVSAVEAAVAATSDDEPAPEWPGDLGYEACTWPGELSAAGVRLLRHDHAPLHRLHVGVTAAGSRYLVHAGVGAPDTERLAPTRLAELVVVALAAIDGGMQRPVATARPADDGSQVATAARSLGRRRGSAFVPVTELLARQAAQDGAASAVVGERTVTRAELVEAAERLASELRRRGVARGEPVGLLFPRGVDAVVAAFACLRASSPYVPLDPLHPSAYLAFVAGDSGIRTALADPALLHLLPADVQALSTADRRLGRPLSDQPAASDPAYILYTSGTTGRPKGVVVPHRGLANLASALDELVYAVDERWRHVALNAPLSFDSSVKQLLAVALGRTVHVVPEDVRADGPALAAWLNRSGIDVLDCTPTQLRLLLPELGARDRPAALLVGGEAVDRHLWEALAAMPERVAFNLYGPTEATVDATVVRITERSVPTLGTAIPGAAVLVLADDGRPTHVGEVGEIAIGGAGVGLGYLDNPDLSAARFVDNSFALDDAPTLYRTGDLARCLEDGGLEYVGRRDRQLKVRGARVEPGEIEDVIRRHPGVAHAVVAVEDDDDGACRLVAHITARTTAAALLATRRRYRLPNGVPVVLAEEEPLDGRDIRHATENDGAATGIQLDDGDHVVELGPRSGAAVVALHQQAALRFTLWEPDAGLRAALEANVAIHGIDVAAPPVGVADVEPVSALAATLASLAPKKVGLVRVDGRFSPAWRALVAVVAEAGHVANLHLDCVDDRNAAGEAGSWLSARGWSVALGRGGSEVVATRAGAARPSRGSARPARSAPDDGRLAGLPGMLREQLPSYLVPHRYVVHDAIAVDERGKVDRRALRSGGEPLRAGDDVVPPRNELEATLLEAWQEVLGPRPLGVLASFFEAGGDSIGQVEVVARLRDAGFEIRPVDVAEHPTVAELAVVLASRPRRRPVETGPARAWVPPEEWALIEEQVARNLAGRPGGGPG